MKLFINKNCSGYHWFEVLLPETGQLAEQDKYIRMYPAGAINEDSAILKGLRMSGQYSYCLAKENGRYILALNNLPEKRTDPDGRHISVTMIFVAENEPDRITLLKILFDYLEGVESFSTRVNDCFVSSIMSNPPSVLCDWIKFDTYLTELSTRNFAPGVGSILPGIRGSLLIASPDSQRTMKDLGFKMSEIDNAVKVIQLNTSSKWLSPLTEKGEKTIVYQRTETQPPIEENPKDLVQEDKEEQVIEDIGTQCCNDEKLNLELVRLTAENQQFISERDNLQETIENLKLELCKKNNSIREKDISINSLNRRLHVFSWSTISAGVVIALLIILFILK